MQKSKTIQKKIKIGLLGCGTIGSYLAEVISKEFSDAAKIVYLCDHHIENAKQVMENLKRRIPLAGLQELAGKCDLVIEAAAPSAVTALMEALAETRNNPALIVMSTGGLIQNPRLLSAYLKGGNRKVYVPSGAIAGVDGLLAARESGLKKVVLRTRKPPQGLRSAPYFKKHRFPDLKGRGEVRVYRGTAADAVEGFPQNINVSAVLSLAGLGAEKTLVEIWSSERYKHNVHEIDIDYKEGRIRIKAENQPSKDNPKTSALAMHSAVALLRKHFSNLFVGS